MGQHEAQSAHRSRGHALGRPGGGPEIDKTVAFYRWGEEQVIRDLERLAGREPTLSDWLDADLQRRRYRDIAERERTGQWRRATVCAQYRSDSGWESFMAREGLMGSDERVIGRVIMRPKDTSPQKAPVSVDILRRIPDHYDEDRYEHLCGLVRIYALVDTLVAAERCSCRATPSGS